MSVVPRIYIEFVADGADGVTDAIGDVSDGLDDVTKSGDKAAKALDGTGKAADKAQTRGQKLWATMKANAGAASGAAGGFAAVSAILNSDMSPAAKTATGVAQGLAAGLNALGPIGQLAGAGISALSSFLIPLIDGMDKAYEPTYSLTEQLERFGNGASFAAQTVGKMIQGFEDASKEAERLKTSLDAGTASIYELYTASEVLRLSNTGSEIKELRKELDLRGEAVKQFLATGEEGAAAFDKLLGAGTSEKALKLGNDRLAQLRETVKFRLEGMKLDEEMAKKRLEDPEKKKGKPVEFPKVEAFVRSSKLMFDNLLGSFENGLIQGQQDALRSAEALLQRTGWMEDFANEAINAQVEAASLDQIMHLQEIESSAAATIGIYDDLSASVSSFGAAAADGLATAAASALLYGSSLKDLVNEQLQALTMQATVEAIKATATGLGYLAAGLFGFGPGLAAAEASFASAAVWAGIAGGAAIGAAATGGFGKGGAGDSTGSGREPTARDLGGPAAGAAAAGPTTLNVNWVANGPMTRVLARETQVGNDLLRRRAG